jgi:hypothetical protein
MLNPRSERGSCAQTKELTKPLSIYTNWVVIPRFGALARRYLKPKRTVSHGIEGKY